MSSALWNYINRATRTKSTSDVRVAQRRDRRRKELLRVAALPVTIELIADPENLLHCFRILKQQKGQGAGADHIRVSELEARDAGDLVSALSNDILRGKYRPQPTLQCRIPKAEPGTFRTLSIPTVLDRVVALAVHDALTPIWETIFADCVWAYRPQRSPWQMLATILTVMERSGRSVMVIDDIKTAFDSVPIQPVMAVHRQMIDGLPARNHASPRDQTQARKRLLDLIRQVLTGVDPSRQRGIPQGSNYSPTALNALLYEHLDTPIIKVSKGPFWHRYSDNLLYLARNGTEGNGKLAEIRNLLKPLGMTLKGGTEDGVLDLKSGAQAHLVGFMIRKAGRQVILGLHRRAWDSLKENLRTAYDTDNPPQVSRDLLAGWIGSHGPAFENGGPTAPEILDLAAQEGFREVASSTTVQRWIDDACTEWQRTRKRVRLAPHVDLG